MVWQRLCFIAGVMLLIGAPLFVSAQANNLKFVPGKTKITNQNGIYLAHWLFDRPPEPDETKNLQIQVIKDGFGTYKTTNLAALEGDIPLGAVAPSDTFSMQVFDPRTNKIITAIALPVPSNTNPGSGNTTSGGNPPAGVPPPATSPPPDSGEGDSQTFTNTIFQKEGLTAGQYFQRLYIWAVVLAIILSVLSLIRAGYIFATGAGNPSSITNAKEIILNVMVGLALLILSYTILKFVLGDRIQEGRASSVILVLTTEAEDGKLKLVT
jgi:hypothetical protein